MKRKPKKTKQLVLEGEQAERLRAIAKRWNVAPEEALRRVLDQAFVGRGALAVVQAGLIALEHWAREKSVPQRAPCVKKAGCALDLGHEGDCQLGTMRTFLKPKIEGKTTEKPTEKPTPLSSWPCGETPTCTLRSGHQGRCKP